ncbi:MAG: hypothetical protein IJ608_01795 [Lachnospiraceae bacterium]|nr:hypothetical protein [Lachnospiraceae bacterium]
MEAESRIKANKNELMAYFGEETCPVCKRTKGGLWLKNIKNNSIICKACMEKEEQGKV